MRRTAATADAASQAITLRPDASTGPVTERGPEVSVLVVARNAGRTIDSALTSVFAQTVRAFEVIVVDDGSDDDTKARIEAFGARVTVLRQPRLGAARAIAAGLQLARGRYVMLLDAADLWMPRKIERQLQYFAQHPDAAFLHGTVLRSARPALTLLDSPDTAVLSPGSTPPVCPGPAVPPNELQLSTVALRRDVLEALDGLGAGLSDDDPVADLHRRCAALCAVGRIDAPPAVKRLSTLADDSEDRSPVSLLHDTCFRRVRARVAHAAHRVDKLLTSRTDGRMRVLFEAASPMSLAVFGPVFRRLATDPRLEFWFTSCDRSWDATAMFRAAGLTERVIRAEQVGWARFDAYINTDFWDMTWMRRKTRRVHFFHGVAGKYGLDAPVRIAPIVATFDRLMFPNRDRLRRYAEAGLVDGDSPRAALIGYPKVDCLVDGSLDKNDVVTRLGLDPQRPIVLYAPTWSPYSSLNLMGTEVIAALGRLDANVVVKLHDRSYDVTTRASGGIDWRERLRTVCQRHGAHLVQDADASPYLHAADLLVTDHSSVGFEFLLLDRPVVVIDSPDLVRHARVNPEKVRQLHSAATVVREGTDVGRAVLASLSAPADHHTERLAIADELFYCPGTATLRAVQCLYELLQLPMPAPSSHLEPAHAVHALAPLARSL
jgi:glycosyltransferase involved in cell wall biosynthesis